jgi:hypothetical protein
MLLPMRPQELQQGVSIGGHSRSFVHDQSRIFRTTSPVPKRRPDNREWETART